MNTFGGYTASRGVLRWIAAVEADVTNLISRLLLAGLAEQENDIIHLTLLGRACGASSLSFESGLRLVELMRQLDASQTQPSLTLAMIQVLDEMGAIYTPVMKRGRSESVRASEVAQRYGQATMQSLQRYCRDESEFWCRCKRALLHDWIEGASRHFQGAVGYGDIMRIVEGPRFYLRSAHQILTTLFPDQPEFLASLDNILRRLEFGLSSNALALTELPIPLTRGQYLALATAGCSGPDDVAALSFERLRDCVGESTAARLGAAWRPAA